MAKRPYITFANVKATISLVDVLKVFGLEDRFKKVGDGLVGVCPIPSHIHGPLPNPDQFKTGLQNGVHVWHCFGDCGRGGDVIELAKAMTGYDNAHVRLWFAEKFPERLNLTKPKEGTGAPKPTVEPVTSKPPAEAPATEVIATPSEHKPDLLKPLRFALRLDPDCEYLTRRGVKAATIDRFGLGLCSKGLLAGYVAIPLHDHPANNIVGYLGRWPGEDYDEAAGKPRYRFPPDFPAHRVVYGLKHALEGTDGQPLIVVEGPFKVFHLIQSGFPNTVSCFSASMSDEQAAILVATGRPIVLFFDGNEAGYRGMRSAAGGNERLKRTHPGAM